MDTVREGFGDKRVASARRLEQRHRTVAVLHVGRVDEQAERSTIGVDHGVALAAKDLLRRIGSQKVGDGKGGGSEIAMKVGISMPLLSHDWRVVVRERRGHAPILLPRPGALEGALEHVWPRRALRSMLPVGGDHRSLSGPFPRLM